jgi:DNA topoisomerase-1
VRDLPPKDGSVDPEHGFDMTWEVGADSKKHVKAIADALKDDNALILATDPDREGEAISWHLKEALRKRKAIKKDTPVSRVVFNAITKTAVTEAMKNPREVGWSLVEAYLARRALDYLVGFNLSPGAVAQAARRGRRVACNRSACASSSSARWRSRRSARGILEREGAAFDAARQGASRRGSCPRRQEARPSSTWPMTRGQASLAVQGHREPRPHRHLGGGQARQPQPLPPFMTSTLQQEASRKFGFGARRPCRGAAALRGRAHHLYADRRASTWRPRPSCAARDAIKDRYGEDYVPDSPRMYKNKAKNAQEAHECIRPTDMTARPTPSRAVLDPISASSTT